MIWPQKNHLPVQRMDKKVKLEQAELFELERVIYRADELDSDGREHAVVGKQRRAENQTRDEAAPKHRARNVKRRRAELRREDLDGFAEQFYTALTLCRAIGQQRNSAVTMAMIAVLAFMPRPLE